MNSKLYTQNEVVPLDCAEHQYHSVSFQLPTHGNHYTHINGFKLFTDPDHLFTHLISIECASSAVAVCRDHDFELDFTYEVSIPSNINGMDKVIKHH